MTSSVLRTSSPIGEDSALRVFREKDLSVEIKWSVPRASSLGEVGGVGLVRVEAEFFRSSLQR